MQYTDINSSSSSSSSSYYQYYQQPHFQTPNPNPNPTPPPDPQFNSPVAAPYASAPPAYSPSDFPNYSPFSQSTNPDHHIPNPSPPPSYAHNPNPNPQSSSASQPYSFPHLDSQYYPYDQPQSNPGYDYTSPGYTNNSYSSTSYNNIGNYSPNVPSYDNVYGNSQNFGAGYDDVGVYKYNGGKADPYGSKGTRSESGSGSGVLFDDYGRPINVNVPSGGKKETNVSGNLGSLPKIVKAVPKVEEQQDAGSGVQKFRVKLLSEGYGQADMDVLCQIGLDGIRILDPATSRTLKIYPLENVTRWEVLDSYIFAFWSKSSVDAEPRRIRLKSNSYTTNNILDTVTAASIQVKEIGGSNRASDPVKGSEQPGEKKKGFVDWMNLIKPGNEEKDHWVPDEAVRKCTSCGTDFNAFVRRHHCRNCGDIFCDKCTQGRIALTADENSQPVRVCDRCMAEVTQRLTNAKEAATKVAGLKSHEDLARKLQEEMDKNRKASTGHTSDGYGTRMREVACPTCTVHLQVEVPASGSETIECSVCQHPFLVSAH